jgi:uncharacterized cupredoxin-like copper-binding protein
MRTRSYVLAGAATLALTGGSLAAVAATGMPTHRTVNGMHPVGTSTCAAPTSLHGQRVTVMLADMGGRGGMMGGGYGPTMMGGGYGPTMMGGWSGPTMMGRTMMLRAFPSTVHAGEVSLVAVNHGTRTHELVVLPLRGGAAVGTRTVRADNRVSEAGSLGEASTSCGRGAGEGIRPGATSWVTVTLAPGRYELVCNLPGHYTDGMYAELDVE